ncbi:MAG: Gfo/Idh/MocA family oxidoreductase [Armatimonadetes bacterium]|nr:Gfo/Idh/MocA family oxidoreductase [Armatimonadota bacterium]
MKKVRLALVGCGGMGRGLVSVLPDLPQARLVAAVDASAGAAQEVAQEHGCDATTDLEAVLARDDVDAVIIATPNHLHAEQAIAAAQAGKHVFTEKPMALRAADAAAMIQAARQAGVKLMVGQVLRYLCPFVWVIENVKRGGWGEPFAAQITRIGGSWTDGRYDRTWRQSGAASGGPLFEIHVHEIDFMCQLFGAPEAVWAVNGHFLADDIDYYDTSEVLVRFAGGRPVQFFTGHSAIEGRYDAKILCTGATVYLEGFGSVHVALPGGRSLDPDPGQLAAQYEPGFRREVREFVEAIAYDNPVPIPGEEGLRAVEVAEAAVRSAETGEVVKLPLVQV